MLSPIRIDESFEWLSPQLSESSIRETVESTVEPMNISNNQTSAAPVNVVRIALTYYPL